MVLHTGRVLTKSEARTWAPAKSAAFRRAAAAVLVLLCASLPASAAHDPVPSLKVSLTPLGYQPMLPDLLAGGTSMVTVNFAGKDRLLVTFGVRHLLQRDTQDPPEDYDHLVGAYYLELPSGRVLAKAEWRLHDRGQYLWDLGNGRFLLRVRDTLSLLNPGLATQPDQALQPRPFLHLDRRIVGISVSAEHDLLTVESADSDQIVLGDSGQTASTSRTPVRINFYRLLDSNGALLAGAAGSLRSPVPLAIPVNSNGYVDATEAHRDQWVFRYQTSASAEQLASFDTTCAPHPVFVSRAEFVAFGCRGSSDRQSIAGFTLSGDNMWQQGLFDSSIAPIFDFAPEAGRFALGRTLVASGETAAAGISAASITGQEIRVYQTYNGKVLLRLTCTPAVRAGQNFSLSADGMQLALLRESEMQHKATRDYDAYTSREAAIELYDLPALTTDDRAAVATIRKYNLPAVQAVFAMASRPLQVAGSHPPDPGENPAQPPASPVSAVSPSSAAESNQPLQAPDSLTGSAVGDIQPTTPRKAPTLYGPDENPAAGHPDQ